MTCEELKEKANSLGLHGINIKKFVNPVRFEVEGLGIVNISPLAEFETSDIYEIYKTPWDLDNRVVVKVLACTKGCDIKDFDPYEMFLKTVADNQLKRRLS